MSSNPLHAKQRLMLSGCVAAIGVCVSSFAFAGGATTTMLAAGAEPRLPPRISTIGQNPLVEVRIAFVTGPNGEVIEFLQSMQI